MMLKRINRSSKSETIICYLKTILASVFLLKIACWSTEETAGKQVTEVERLFNLFQVNASFLSPLKTAENLKISTFSWGIKIKHCLEMVSVVLWQANEKQSLKILFTYKFYKPKWSKTLVLLFPTGN